MEITKFLILFPLLPAVALLFVKQNTAKRAIVFSSVIVLCIATVMLGVSYNGGRPFSIGTSCHMYDKVVLAADIILFLVFLGLCFKLPARKMWIPALIIGQYVPFFYYEFKGAIPETPTIFYLDNLTVVMAFVIAFIGGLITVYTPAYLDKYHEEEPDVKDRSGLFLFAVFLFFSAMFGIIFSAKLTWIYFFWEVTTLCSFIMIGYSRKPEAFRNSFRALWMLMLGGAGFVGAIIYASRELGTINLFEIVKMEQSMVLLPVVLICLAGINKAAQFPFSQWLLGAMVAPTPSSALLHSSTMVKAGVYICLRCSPAITDTWAGGTLAMVGGVSFLIASAIAVTESDGKRVLAYSTVANLGLIVLCAGVGTAHAMWAAVLLIIFHAISKALLFCCVGVVEQQTHSRDIEDMKNLVSRMPFMTALMLVGIAGMFLAPFGMLISKWATLQAVSRGNPLIPAMIIFGGTLMLFFWTKWMGNLIIICRNGGNKEKGIPYSIWVPLWSMAGLTMLMCLTYPLVGSYVIEPLYGAFDPVFNRSNIIMMGIMFVICAIIPLGFLISWKNVVISTPYLSGANLKEDPEKFVGSMGVTKTGDLRNYYFKDYFGEAKLLSSSNFISVMLLIVLFFMGYFGK